MSYDDMLLLIKENDGYYKKGLHRLMDIMVCTRILNINAIDLVTLHRKIDKIGGEKND